MVGDEREGREANPGANAAGWVVLGTLRRPWGRNGELALDLQTDWPDQRFARGVALSLRYLDGRALEATSAGYRVLSGAGPLLRLEGVDSIEAARRFAGAEIVGRLASLERICEAEDWLHGELIGARVETMDGRAIGTVVAISEGAHGDLLEVAGPPGGTVLIPLAREICRCFQRDESRILVDPPDGLLDQTARAGPPR